MASEARFCVRDKLIYLLKLWHKVGETGRTISNRQGSKMSEKKRKAGTPKPSQKEAELVLTQILTV